MNFRTTIIFPLLTIFLFLLFLELIFYFLPVSDDFNFNEVNEKNPIFHAKINNKLITSKFWYFYNLKKLISITMVLETITIIIKIRRMLFRLLEILMLKQFR